jgi:hypothetical protein
MNAVWSLITGVVNAVLAVISGNALRVLFHPQTHTKEFSVEVVRPDDLLVLTLDFYNIRLQGTGPGPLQVDRVAAGDGFVVAHFQPQSFGEQAFFEASPGVPVPSDPLSPPPVASRIAGPSQLVFRVAPDLLPFAFNLDTILEVLTKCEQATQDTIERPAPVPAVGGRGRFGGFRAQFSRIEAPYRVVLSPDAESRWTHAFSPVPDPSNKRTELWHTRLSSGATAAAVWSPDYQENNVSPANNDLPFRMSLKRKNRHEIVRSTSDPSLLASRPVNVAEMMLTSQGASLNVRGEWDPPIGGMDLVEWQHVMTGGRDQFAKVVEAGYLCSLGHRCVLVTITERKVQMGTSGNAEGQPIAYLRQRKLIFLRQLTKTYAHRDSPFRTVTFKTDKTPNLDLPSDSQILAFGEDAFWPRVNGQDFLFHVVATDWEGKVHEYHTPQAFVIKSLADDPNHTRVNQVIGHVNTLPIDGRRDRPMHGQKIAYAPSVVPGDTTYETEKIIFGATGATASPFFLPAMTRARVDVPAVRHLTGSTAFCDIQYKKDYVDTPGSSVIGNIGEVFAELVGSQTPVGFSSDQTGGMVAPNFGISGLSRGAGPVGGKAAEFGAGNFNPADIFKNIKLFGGVDIGGKIEAGKEIAGIIGKITNLIPSGPSVPKLKTISTTALIGGVSKEVFQTSYRWDLNAGGLVDQSVLPTPGMFKPESNGRFLIEAITNTPLDGSKGTSTVHGLLENFTITLMPATPLVALHFTKAEFTTLPDAKTDFAIIFNKFEFLGVLAFVNKLLEVIPLDGFDDPPFLRLTPPPQPGVEVGFTQGIPTIGIGIFTLQNISFGASFYLPFLAGAAVMRFAFCERHQPFTLTVMLFGGGGFFAIEIGLDGVKAIEASLEFGASVALDLGVASGQACIMGGVYYRGSPEGFILVGYFRAAGSLTVLGFITVSVELYVGLGYASKGMKPHGGHLWGQASISVKVKIAFFSVSVSIGIEREFAGSDPKFIDSISATEWIEYCNAFADCPV